jgi:hypothetical protein
MKSSTVPPSELLMNHHQNFNNSSLPNYLFGFYSYIYNVINKNSHIHNIHSTIPATVPNMHQSLCSSNSLGPPVPHPKFYSSTSLGPTVPQPKIYSSNSLGHTVPQPKLYSSTGLQLWRKEAHLQTVPASCCKTKLQKSESNNCRKISS